MLVCHCCEITATTQQPRSNLVSENWWWCFFASVGSVSLWSSSVTIAEEYIHFGGASESAVGLATLFLNWFTPYLSHMFFWNGWNRWELPFLQVYDAACPFCKTFWTLTRSENLLCEFAFGCFKASAGGSPHAVEGWVERASNIFHLCFRELMYFYTLFSFETKGCSFIVEISKVMKMIRKASHCWNHVLVQGSVFETSALQSSFCSALRPGIICQCIKEI